MTSPPNSAVLRARDRASPPASVEKLYTAVTALEKLGPAARLSTNVLGVGHPAAGGVWAGNCTCAARDPTFGTTSFIAPTTAGGASVSTLVRASSFKVDGHPIAYRLGQGDQFL